jgi:outer membrane protein OmpA-like peptidoglycan-associated protein
MKKIYLIIAIVSTTFFTIAQEVNPTKLKKANKFFDGFSYDKAIETFSESGDNSTESLRKLGLAYFNTGKLSQADSVFAIITSKDDATSEDVYTYASILEENKKYTQAELWMKKFVTLSPLDKRAIAYQTNKAAYDQLSIDKGQFKIKNLEINSAQEDFAPIFYKDKVVFASSREGVKPIRRKWNWNKLPFLDLYEANRADDYELSNANRFLNRKFNKKYHEGPVTFNKEATKMWFTQNNYKGKSSDGTIKLQIWSSEINEDGKWSKPVAFPLNSNEYSVGHTTISNDGKWMYFASDMPGGLGGVDLYKIEIKEDGTYGEAINLGGKINTEGNEMFPTVHKNGMLFFASDGLAGLGGLDVFVAQIKADGSFGKVMNLGAPINSNNDDFALILDNSAKGGYFSSNREGGKGDDDIYSFTLLKPFTFGKIIKGTAKDKKGNILANATVNLYDEKGNVIETTTTDEKGTYEFQVEADKKFKLDGKKEKYFDGENTADTHTEEDVVIADVVLEKDPGLSLYAIVTDKKTGAPLENVTVTLVDNMTGEQEVYTTPTTGDLRKALQGKKIGDRGSYNITLQKEGYFSKTVTYNTEFDHEGQYDVHSTLDLGMDIEVKDLAEMIQINPINFDFNKYNIRPDAAKELDKIVEIMNKYPGMVVELGSHTDCRGSDAYNEKLSDRRAKASAKYIKERITNPDRIYGKGYGEYRPLEDCGGNCKACTDAQHDANRRTEFKVIKTGNDDIKVINTSADSFDKEDGK